MIKDIKDINRTTHDGRLLFAALVLLTTENRRNKTPDEVIQELNELATKIDGQSYEK